jgi:hypothetical protein
LLAGGFTGYTHNDVVSLGYMERIVIDFDQLQPLHDYIWVDGVLGSTMESVIEESKIRRIDCFWQVLQQRFPCATHIVLSETIAWKAGASQPRD